MGKKLYTHMPEKLRGKFGSNHDHAKRARVAREEARPTASDNEHRMPKEGICKRRTCIEDKACYQFPNNTYACLCQSTGELPPDGSKCPRSTVSKASRPIPIYMPARLGTPSSSQVSRIPMSSEVFTEDASGADNPVLGAGFTSRPEQTAVVIGGALLVLVITLITITGFYFRRRLMNKNNGKPQPRGPRGEPLLAERYITNPQYGVCGAGGTGTLPNPGNPNDGDEKVPLIGSEAVTFLEEVGEGCFGKVHKGLLRTTSGEKIIAIKVLKDSASRSAEEDFVREVSIMSAFRHENILTLIGVVYRNDINATPWMVFEYMEWGDLAGVLRGSRDAERPSPTLDKEALLQVALQVASGMRYLAKRRFVHRDLAARNCLVGGQLSVKIADFGMSRDVYTSDYYKMGGERPMPVRWMSPESIVYARFTHESDVWSYGVVLWEIYSRGKQPYYGRSNDGATKLILQGILLIPPEECPPFAWELMRACWKTDPRERITFDEICRKLEMVAEGVETQIPLARPPLAQDSEGYLLPTVEAHPEYLKLEMDSEMSEDEEVEEEDYT